MHSAQTRQLAEAITGFLNEPPPGTPPPVIAGLQNLLRGLSAPLEGNPSPGHRAAVEAAEESESHLEDDEESFANESVSPGKRAAMESASR